MNKLQLKQLRVKNFKGFKNETFNLKEITNILGANGTGKTSIFDAVIWLLFGKDHLGQTDFAIKPQDKDGNIIHKLETEVEGMFIINGKETAINRTLIEKWVKKRGKLKPTFEGNKTNYYWNEVPKKQSEFQTLLGNILDENVFKLITDPLAFGELHWEAARNILTQIAGEVTDEEIASTSKDFEELLNQINQKGLKGYKDELKSKRKRLNDDLKQIPTRIDEVHNNKPGEVDVDAVNSEKDIIEKNIIDLEDQIQDRNKAQEKEFQTREKLQEELLSLKYKKNKIVYAIEERVKDDETDLEIEKLKTQRDEHTGQIKDLNSKLKQYQEEFNANKDAIKDNKESIVKKREEWDAENKKELKFDDENFKCPTCKKPLEEHDIETEKENMLIDFTSSKQESLKILNKQGQGLVKTNTALEERNNILKGLIQDNQTKLNEQTTKQSKVNQEIGRLEAKLELKIPIEELINAEKERSKDLKDINAKISKQEEAINNRPGYDVKDLQSKLKTEKENLEGLKTKLNNVEEIKKADTRIEELSKQEEKLAQQIADLEHKEFNVEAFETKKYTALEEKVNKMFKLVKIKMFKQLVNGDMEPACIPMVGGVPFNKGLNTAARINAGIDIINILSEHFQVTAPIFIDNRESVTALIDTPSQVINLIVSPQDKTLTIK